MARSKRPAFTFPELESRGRRAILRSAQEVSADLEALERATLAAEEDGKDRVKVTYRFHPEAVEAVEDIRRILRRQHGVKKVNREDIAQAAVMEALRQLEQAGGESFIVQHFTGRP
jgi:DNA-binding transcriptional ArsR family regulator